MSGAARIVGGARHYGRVHTSRAPERPAPSGPSTPTPDRLPAAEPLVPLGGFGPNDEAKRRDLRRMKMLALGFFLGATVIFLVAKYLEVNQGLAWAGYVRASAEAGMVGALADWFAVTALFRHPLRIPIPHTAIIPRKKDVIGDSLGDFVGENFLSEAVVRDKLDRVGLSLRVGGWIAQQENADRITAELTAAARGIVTVLRDEDVQNVVESVAVRKLLEIPVGPPLGKALEGVLADGAHKRLVDLVCDRAYDWVADNQEMVLRVVHDRAPSWTPRFVDEMVADKVFAEIRGYAWAVKNDPDHQLRHAVDRYLAEFARDLQFDETTIERAEQVKRQVVEHPEVQHFIGRAWTVVKGMVLDAAEDPSNELRLRVRDAIIGLGRRLESDAELREKIDGWVADVAGYVVRHYRHEITTLITETVARWDAEETSKKIELQVGRDLQWIRINGTVVGALAGLVIYTISELII